MTRHELHEISSEFTPVDNQFGYDSSTHPKKLFVSPAEALKRGWLSGAAEEAQLRIIMKFMIDHQARLSEEAGLVEFFGLYLIGYEEECLVFWFEGGQPEFDDRPWFCNYDCTLVWLHRSVLQDPDIENKIFAKVVRKTKIGVRKEVWTEVVVPGDEHIGNPMTCNHPNNDALVAMDDFDLTPYIPVLEIAKADPVAQPPPSRPTMLPGDNDAGGSFENGPE